MNKTRKGLFPGIALILLGLVFLLPSFTHLRMHNIWPAWILVPGIAFFVVYFNDRSKYGLLMPATILTVIGLTLLSHSLDIAAVDVLWPVFILAPGLGLLLMYFFGKKETALLVPGTILSVVGIIFLLGTTEYDYLWPAVLIVIGAVLLFNAKK